jgi:hypothetical protein
MAVQEAEMNYELLDIKQGQARMKHDIEDVEARLTYLEVKDRCHLLTDSRRTQRSRTGRFIRLRPRIRLGAQGEVKSWRWRRTAHRPADPRRRLSSRGPPHRCQM